ncbi:hypothetical protein RND81_04G227500 [Saponaria officinalis]|uniref:Uncharacterized protein n=1 Tax=Saponaria officinalis TaxID=3572 RepID=A0AAW1LPZ5_SAPOF
MTIEEANDAEAFLEESLAKVQQRMNQLSENQDSDATQPPSSMIEAENATKNPSDEAHHVEPEQQQGEDSDRNNDQMRNHSAAPDRERRLANNMFSEMTSPQSGMSFSNLLTSADAPETLSPIRVCTESIKPTEIHSDVSSTNLIVPQNPSMPLLVTSQPPDQNNGNSFHQSQYGFLQDNLVNAHQIYPNVPAPEVIQSSGQNGSNYGTTPNSYIIPNNNLPSPNYQFPSSLASFQPPQQTPFHLQSPNPNAVPPAQSSYYQIPPQLPLAENSRTSFFNNLQWPSQNNLQQNQTLFGQQGGYQEMFTPISDINNIYPQDAGSPAAYFRQPNLPVNNHQIVAGHGMGRNLALNLQGPLPNAAPQGLLGHQMNAVPGHLEAVGSPSSSNKRKLPWDEDDDDIALRLSDNPNMNPAPNSVVPAPRQSTNAVYNISYELMGLPIDPHFRMYEEMVRREGSGSNQQPPNQ